jgi:hypothetical protein
MDEFDDMFQPPAGFPKPNPMANLGHTPRPRPQNYIAPPMPQAPQAVNPLARYFRAPGINVTLPTGGAFLPEGSISFDMDGKIQVLPMTAEVELLMKSPDALMSGFAIEQMIRSCVPGIQVPRQVSTPDLDVILLAVRAASFGSKMEIDIKCPSCGEETTFACDLPTVLDTVKEMPREIPVRLSADVIVYLRPFTLENSTKISLTTYYEARALQQVEEASDEVRTAKMNESYHRMARLSSDVTADSILYVAVPEGVVQDRAAIVEFMRNIPSEWTKKIDAALKELGSYGIDRSLAVACPSCQHEFSTQLEFDPSSFFG